MIKRIVLTPNAVADLESISEWLSEKLGARVLDNFLSLFESKLLVIAEHPNRYPIIHKTSILRKAVLTRHNIILYREHGEQIEIISIFDTRQDPDKISSLVKDL